MEFCSDDIRLAEKAETSQGVEGARRGARKTQGEHPVEETGGASAETLETASRLVQDGRRPPTRKVSGTRPIFDSALSSQPSVRSPSRPMRVIHLVSAGRTLLVSWAVLSCFCPLGPTALVVVLWCFLNMCFFSVRFLEKDVIRSLEASEGTKRRTEQMIEILQKEVVQMQQREEEAGKEAAEVSFGPC